MSPRRASIARPAPSTGIIFVAPDTSPRGEGVPDDPEGAWDFGQGAGFYVDATEEPWAAQLPHVDLCHRGAAGAGRRPNFPVDMERQGITGHSMGGHGALTVALRHPGRFRSVSAFAPIVAPSQVPWGEKALGRLSRAGPVGVARA